ncbi:HlyD family secretion protein [Bradyrhizobium sp. dw_411]|uniref:HlyD family secretion protein n=1 Tax=Bradyrhizobium sp. dw_411 TaxID=2720082 RepID=UPI001BD155DD|nr:HlyD family secretion protein [Bradyrhizobium sp. dw_411]
MSSADARDIRAVDPRSEGDNRRHPEEPPVRDRIDVSAKGEQRDTGRKNPDENPDKNPKQADSEPKEHGPSGFSGAIKKHPIAMIVCLGLIVAGVVAGTLWYFHARHFESTDDAFIDGRPVLISPQVTGNIVQVNVTDNQPVKSGDLLAKIDPRDYQASVDQAAAQIRQSEATMKNIDAQIAVQRSQIEQANKQEVEAQAALNFSQDENKRYQDLVNTGAGTVQRAQQASSDLLSKQAGLAAASAAKIAAERQIDVLEAQKGVAAAQLDQSKAQKDQADANLGRTELRATVDGRVAKLTAAVGALAAPAQAIMVVVPFDVWVTANFKESQLADMRVGQPVTISIDAFGQSFPGHVDGVQAGSGTAFSLLPAENATGNYVKVVQRVPVKITFDARPEIELGPGMSVVPSVTVRP